MEKRSELESAVANRLIDGMKALELLGDSKESDVKIDILISLEKSASMENLKDMVGFIEFGKINKMGDEWVLSNLIHDINGLANNELCFSPRSTGYASI